MPRMINDPVPKNKAPSTQQLASLLTSGKSGQGRCCSMLLHTLLTFRAPLGSLASVLGARWVVSSLQRSRIVRAAVHPVELRGLGWQPRGYEDAKSRFV